MQTYITTPIYYVNGGPHIGHAYTDVMADILARVYKMRGHNVFVTTGTDEHGQKNQQAAEESSLSTEEYLTRQSGRFRALFDRLNVDYDYWVRTTDPQHVIAVQEAEQRLYDKGLIIFQEYTGLYCVGCEQFKKTTDLDDMGNCPDHGVQPLEMTEENYFLHIQPYQEWLIAFIQDNPTWIQPEHYQRELLAMLQEPLDDLCISRPKERVTLGVELPFDSNFVTYVWFDALLNYITNIGWPANFDEDKWRGSLHLMAKDIIKTHCIYWPIMLKALDIPPPAKIRVHGYWVGKGGVKMSKSRGNVVDPDTLIDLVGSDGVRYYLAKAMKTGDSQIYDSIVVETYNIDLANKFGNMLSRVTRLVQRYCDGRVPEATIAPDSEEAALQQAFVKESQEILETIDLHDFYRYVEVLLSIAERLNKYFEKMAPWKVAKESKQLDKLYLILYFTLDSLRILLEMSYPIIPEAASKALQSLDCALPVTSGQPHHFAANRLQPGVQVDADLQLFPRLKQEHLAK